MGEGESHAPKDPPVRLDYATPPAYATSPQQKIMPLSGVIAIGAVCHFGVLLLTAGAAGMGVPFAQYVALLLASPGIGVAAIPSGDMLLLPAIVLNSVLWGTGWAAVVTSRDDRRPEGEWRGLLGRCLRFRYWLLLFAGVHIVLVRILATNVFRDLGGEGTLFHLDPEASPRAIRTLYICAWPASLLARQWGTQIEVPYHRLALLGTSLLWGVALACGISLIGWNRKRQRNRSQA
jgi:hypothetical protein